MKKVEINGKLIEVPTSITAITVEQLEKCVIIFNQDISSIDRYIKLFSVILNVTEDDVANLDIDLFKELVDIMNTDNFWIRKNELITKVEINGKIFKTRCDGKSYKFNVKEIMLIQDILKTKTEGFLLDIVSIIFKSVDENENIINDLSAKSIEERKEYLKDLNVDIVIPYILSLTKLSLNA